MLRIYVKNLIVMLCVVCLGSSISLASPSLRMKLLVLAGSADEPSYMALTKYMNESGIPYDAVLLNTVAADGSGSRLNSVQLTDTANGIGMYQGIVVADSSFSGCRAPCLSAVDWSKLDSYAVQYGVRTASYYTEPNARWGLAAANGGASYTQASPLNVTLTSAGAAVFSYLNSANAVPVSGGSGGYGIWAYLATPVAANNETTTPVLMAGNYSVGVLHTAADGRETLALTMDNYPDLLHSAALSYGVINWVTRGVFLGSRRVYLNPQIDDIFMGNRLYDPSRPECPNDPSCPTVWASAGQDMQALARWQSNVKGDPRFQSFRNTFSFVGIGTTWYLPSDPLFSALKTVGSQFGWESHTYDHANLDCYSLDSSGNCLPATLAQSQAELSQNIAVANQYGLLIDPVSVVQPFNGGTANPNFVQAAAQLGIRYIGTAATESALQVGIVDPLNSSVLEVPRRIPDLFDDVSSPSTNVAGSWPDEYNAMYGPGGSNSLYSTTQTYAQVVDHVSQGIFLNNMLTFEPYPLQFHVANVYSYDGTHSLYSDLMDATIAKYKKIFTLPVISLDQQYVGSLLANRASYNASGVTGVYTPGVGVVLSTTNAATIPITGACSKSSCSAYGGQIQDSVTMPAHTSVSLSLTASQAVSLQCLVATASSVIAGNTVTATVTLSGPAPADGAAVVLASNSASVLVPSTVTVAAGGTAATFQINTVAGANASASITASYGGVNRSIALVVTAGPKVNLLTNPNTINQAPWAISGSGTIASATTISAAGLLSLSNGYNRPVVTANTNYTATMTVAVSGAGGNCGLYVYGTGYTSTLGSTASVLITAPQTFTANFNSGSYTSVIYELDCQSNVAGKTITVTNASLQ